MGVWLFCTRRPREDWDTLTRLQRDQVLEAAKDMREKGW